MYYRLGKSSPLESILNQRNLSQTLFLKGHFNLTDCLYPLDFQIHKYEVLFVLGTYYTVCWLQLSTIFTSDLTNNISVLPGHQEREIGLLSPTNNKTKLSLALCSRITTISSVVIVRSFCKYENDVFI